MITIKKDTNKDVEFYKLYKVSDKHYILNIYTKQKYYEDWYAMSGDGLDVIFDTPENDLGYEIAYFRIHIDVSVEFDIPTIIPLKYEYQIHIMHNDILYVNNNHELVEEG